MQHFAGWQLQLYSVSPSQIDIILKAIILKTTESSAMKLNSLGVEHHKFILGLIS